MLNIVTCIKQVPDTTQVHIDPETNTLIREGIPAIINPFDLHAIEAAVQLKRWTDSIVGIVTISPARFT